MDLVCFCIVGGSGTTTSVVVDGGVDGGVDGDSPGGIRGSSIVDGIHSISCVLVDGGIDGDSPGGIEGSNFVDGVHFIGRVVVDGGINGDSPGGNGGCGIIIVVQSIGCLQGAFLFQLVGLSVAFDGAVSFRLAFAGHGFIHLLAVQNGKGCAEGCLIAAVELCRNGWFGNFL